MKKQKPSFNVPSVNYVVSQEESDKKMSSISLQQTTADHPLDLTETPSFPEPKTAAIFEAFKSSDNKLADIAEVSYSPELNKCQEHLMLSKIT
eukprot:5339871-Ditylum_brightwellii.AAC.1